MKAGFLALQCTAAAYPPGEYRAGFLAALAAVRTLFDIKADPIASSAPAAIADLPDFPPPAVADSVRVLPPAPPARSSTAPQLSAAAPVAQLSGVAADGRRFAIRGEIAQWDGQITTADPAPASVPVITAADLTSAYYDGIAGGVSREFAAGAGWMALQIGIMIGANLPIRVKG